MAAPITLILYGAENEKIKDLSRAIVPWGILKKAVALTKGLDKDNIDEADIDAIADLVVSIFEGQVTRNELDAGADVGEMIAVLQNVVSRASALVSQNPTPPPPKKK